MVAWPLFGIWLACICISLKEKAFSKAWYLNQYYMLIPAMAVSLYLVYLGG